MEPLEPWRIVAQLFVVGSAWILCLVLRTPYLRIVGLCIAATVAYGILQDQITARLCPEYFTVGHQPIEGVTDPTLLGIAWGFLGSWWGGLFFGIALACSSHLGSMPTLQPRQLVRPILAMLACVAVVSLLTGLGTHYNASILQVTIGEPWASQIAPERHRNMLVVANVHFAAYASTILGSIALCVRSARLRSRLARSIAS